MIPSLFRTRGTPALALVLAACGGGPGVETAPAPAAAPRSESAAFVATIGTDTVSVERYTRTATTLSGEVVTRSPRTTSRAYTAQLRPDGTVSRVEVTTRALTAAPSTPPTVTTVEFAGDTAAVRIARGDSVQTQRVAGASAFPLVGGSYAFYEQAILHTRAAGTADARLRFVAPGNAQPVAVELRSQGPDSLLLVNIAGRSHVRTDAEGHIQALNGLESTQKVVLQRLPALDVAALGASYAQREASGRGLGTLSPRDSVRATVGGARIVIDYGRPLRRGRRVVGEVVPLDQVWRTGANAATGFRTDRDLLIGGTRVPAGAYTLFTLPSAAGWKLIVNRQTGQWGTEYHPEQDLARIDLQRRAVSPPVEQFTIQVDPAGVLRMLWDDVELSAPIEVR